MVALLEKRGWWLLRTAAKAYGLPFRSDKGLDENFERLHAGLFTGGKLKKAFRGLTETEREALVALQAAGGTLPLSPFTAAFGQIRPFRPWRNDLERIEPWKRPVSTAEKLWHLAFIEIVEGQPGHDDQVVIADEVLALLPPLPRVSPPLNPLPKHWGGDFKTADELSALASLSSADIARARGEGMASPPPYAMGRGQGVGMHDLAVFLALLLAEDVRPLHGRWLPPSVIRLLNTRTHYKEDCTETRSEFQAGYPRFLHYLAEIMGFVSLQNGLLKPTPRAWEWLNQPDWQILWEAVCHDLAQREPLWNGYRLPESRSRLWAALVKTLDTLAVDQPYTVASLLETLEPHLFFLPYAQRKGAGVRALLDGPLRWIGKLIMSTDSTTFTLNPATPYCPQPAALHDLSHQLEIDLPPFPDLRVLVEIGAFAAWENNVLCIDLFAMRRAVELGYTPEQIAPLLAALTGAPISAEVYARIETWTRQAANITLRTVTLLTVNDAETLAEIRADWRLRPLLGETLSSHHVVVKTDHAEALAQKLERRGHAVVKNPAPGKRDHPSSPAPSPSERRDKRRGNEFQVPLHEGVGFKVKGEVEYAYLGARVYQRLGNIIPLDVRLPASVTRALAQHFAPGRADALDQTASVVIDRLNSTMNGQQIAAGGVAQDDPAAIWTAVQIAYAERGALTIEYFSPNSGETTIRTIEPVMLYSRNGADYVEAWCQREDDTRTFRLDRILRVLPDAIVCNPFLPSP